MPPRPAMSLRLPSLSANKLLPFAFWLFLFSLPLGTRKLLWRFTAGFDEYEAVFLYASDIFLAAFLVLFCFSRGFGGLRPKIGGNFLAASLCFLVLFSAFSVLSADYSLLALTAAIRLFLAVAAALAVAALLREGVVKFERVALALATLAVLQSFIGFGQFAFQSGLGLKFFGEPEIDPLVGGAAKILAGGGKLLRAYGTFPHPNVFAAFLLLGLFSLFYIWLKLPSAGQKTGIAKRFAATSGLFVVLAGLAFSFSRAAWFVAALLAAIFLARAFWAAETRKRAAAFLFLLAAFVSIIGKVYGFALFPRAQISSGEPAVVYRLAYNELGTEIVKNNFFGVGIGNQVIYAVKNGLYRKLGMTERWQWQPIHNIYVLMAAEIGVLGLLAFLLFLGRLFLSIFAGRDLFLMTSAAMLSALLLLGFFDHFLWTLQPGRLMLWLAAGLVLGAVRPRG